MSSPAFVPCLPLASRPLQPRVTRITHSAPRCVAPAMELEQGTRVRVNRSIVMYHYPGKKNTPVDVDGYVGVIIADKSVTQGVPMSATTPYVVDFKEEHPRFKAHFQEDELDVVEE